MAGSSPTFDYVPTGVPPQTTSEIEAAIETATSGRIGDAVAWDAMLDAQISHLRTDDAYRDEVRSIYERSTVDLLSPTVWSTDPRLSFVEGVYRDLARWEARFSALEWMEKVTAPAGARSVSDAGDVGMILNVQDLGSFTDGQLDRVDALFDAGIRIFQLTYNTQNSIGAGCTDDSGSALSTHGHAVVDRLNDYGGIVDLSHCNRETTIDAIDVSEDPVAFTHVHCAALDSSPRAKTDVELEHLAAADGYVGILAYPTLYDEPTLDAVFEHFEHAKSIVGPDRIGIATDWWSTTPDVPWPVRSAIAAFYRETANMRQKTPDYEPLTPDRFDEGFEEFRSYEEWPVIRESFADRGYDEATIDRFLGGNFLEFWERVVG
ncbi:dipeptidase [Natrarchaeobius chitinivorans]|uniref:Peptidase M19 n=1 Tax=Natrarchaeobius chitinivorans TaxID=1679083 RepID=A0A3N6MJ79_NATCH|nr:membrane dipeptidase [Natrarchaeobius chitinivorans]RQG94186.1 peptidase M19 [Natrarchaeobius chitinivorans]